MIRLLVADDEPLVRALDVRAVDCVLKPVDDDQFARVLTRAKQQVHARANAG